MDIETIGFIMSESGKILVAYTVIMVHYRVWKEHAIDEVVFHAMRNERVVGLIGITLMIVGFAIQLPARL